MQIKYLFTLNNWRLYEYWFISIKNIWMKHFFTRNRYIHCHLLSQQSKENFENIPGHKQASGAHLPLDGDPSVNLHNFQLIDN